MTEKFCKYCGEKIASDAVICVKCGRQVESVGGKDANSPIIINNNNSASSASSSSAYAGYRYQGRRCSKWVALLLCIFLGWCVGHKFYEGKIGTGLVYLFTMGIFFFGIVIDFFNILGKTDPYYAY